MIRSAEFSECRTYRYALYRIWDREEPLVMFVGLNPSTADEMVDDPTVRRCVRFAEDWGAGGLIMANIYGFRATKPADLRAAEDPVGPGMDEWLAHLGVQAGTVIAAWGGDARPDKSRPKRVAECLPPLSVLGLTQNDAPRHPLYMPASSTPIEWAGP